MSFSVRCITQLVLGLRYLKRLNRIAGETAPFSVLGCAEVHATELTIHQSKVVVHISRSVGFHV